VASWTSTVSRTTTGVGRDIILSDLAPTLALKGIGDLARESHLKLHFEKWVLIGYPSRRMFNSFLPHLRPLHPQRKAGQEVGLRAQVRLEWAH
jgi:hypothetical protein